MCFKIVPDLEMMSDDDWNFDNKFCVDTTYIKNMWNCFDESALELTLKLSDLSEGFDVIYNLEALTIGNSKCDLYLRTLYALGYSKTVRIECNDDLRFQPELVANVIAQYIKKNNVDVIIMGKQSSDGNNGKTPLLLAEYMGYKCITEVIDIQPYDDNYIKIKNETDEGIVTQVVKTPCVLSVGNVASSYLRVPTLKNRMTLGKKDIVLENIDNFNVDKQNDIKIVDIKKMDTKRCGDIVIGESCAEKVSKLYNEYIKERLDKL